MSTGMPRPSSATRQPPSASRVTSMRVACPAIASSTELSTTSHTRWCRPLRPVDPMYIPGRFRTASRPSRMVMSFAPYEADGAACACAKTRPFKEGVEEATQPQKCWSEDRIALTAFYQRGVTGPGLSAPAHPKFDRAHDAVADGRRQPVEKVALEEAELRRPGRMVDSHDEHAVAQRHGSGVVGDLVADDLGPPAEHRPEGGRGGH